MYRMSLLSTKLTSLPCFESIKFNNFSSDMGKAWVNLHLAVCVLAVDPDPTARRQDSDRRLTFGDYLYLD